MQQFHSEDEAVQAVKSLMSKKLFQHAHAAVEEGLSHYPKSPRLRFQSAELALETNDFVNALTILEKLNAEDPHQASVLLPLARAWDHSGEIDKAIQCLDEAEQAGADKLIIAIVRAEFYERSGKLDLLDECMGQISKEALSVNIRARALVARKDYIGAIDLLESDYEKGALGLSDIMNNCFILAKAYDRIGEYDKAWKAAEEAHELDPNPFNTEVHFATYEKMMDFMSRDMLDALVEGPKTDVEPFYIVGNPRSGTSLLEQILSMHPDIENAGEISTGHKMQLQVARITDSFHKWPANIVDIREQDAQLLSNMYVESISQLAEGHKVVSNKALNLSLQLGFLSKILPSSRAVILHRHPLDNAVSCYTNNLLVCGHGYSNNLETLAKTWVYRKKIAEHWLDTLSIPMMELHYEQLVADQRGETERLVKFLGLPWNEDCMEFHKSKRVARTISYDQVNQKMYATSDGRWKNYEKNLGPVIDVVSEYL